MSFWEPLNLMQLPLSAYTPGQGDPKMEGGWETSSGAPVYTFEMWKRGAAPYVTGATSNKNPTGAMVYRTIGDQRVPVKITDYGPGVKGIDIASSNSKWANNFPFQGARDKFGLLADDRRDLMNEIDNSIYGGGQAPLPTPTPTPTPQRVAVGDGMSFGQFAQQSPSVAGAGQMGTWSDYAKALNTPSAIGTVGGALSSLGSGMQKQGQQGMQQALAMLSQRSPASGLLDQFANNPLQFLMNPYLQG